MSIPRRTPPGVGRARIRNPDFHARLRRIVGSEQPFAWAKRVGISKGAFTRIWKQGTIPTAELLLRIRQLTGVSLDWLLTGEGNPGGAGAGRADGDALVQVPVLALTRAEPRRDGAFIALAREFASSRLGADPEHLAVVRVRGEAMSPTLADGDFAVIDRGRRSIGEDALYALRQKGTLRILRVQRLSGGRFQAGSDNPRYKPFVFTARSGVAIAGRVVCAVRIL